MNVQKLSSLDLPELEAYRSMRRSMYQVHEGIFIAEGEKTVRRLLQSKHQIISVLMTADWLNRLQSDLESRLDINANVWIASEQLMNSLVGIDLHQGLLALGKIPLQPDL